MQEAVDISPLTCPQALQRRLVDGAKYRCSMFVTYTLGQSPFRMPISGAMPSDLNNGQGAGTIAASGQVHRQDAAQMKEALLWQWRCLAQPFQRCAADYLCGIMQSLQSAHNRRHTMHASTRCNLPQHTNGQGALCVIAGTKLCLKPKAVTPTL